MGVKYEINFDATNTKGEVVQNIILIAGPFYPDEVPVCKTNLALQRFCVEYARLVGVHCSFADIHFIREVG